MLTRLEACEDIPAGGDVPAVFHGVLRDLVLAARDRAGPAWLAAASDDPGVVAFTALQATPVPPAPAELDEIISRVLWALYRFRTRCRSRELRFGSVVGLGQDRGSCPSV